MDPEPESATTKAGDWLDARLEGRRLPEHELPDEPETEAVLWTMEMESRP